MIAFDQQLQTTTAAIVRGYRPERIILFGSRARGTHQPGSDVDLLIIKRTHKTPLERVREVVRHLPHTLDTDLIVLTPTELRARQHEDNYLVHEILATGRTIYQHLPDAARR